MNPEPGPMPWPVPGLSAEKYASMVREIRGMSCAIALYRKRQGNVSGALSAFRDGIQSLQFIVNNAGDAPHDSIDFSPLLKPTTFAGTDSVTVSDCLLGDDAAELAREAISALRYKHDWLRDGKRPSA